jgi:hypothetical protein
MKIPRKDLGQKPSSGYEYDDLPDASDSERKYSGHYKCCPKMLVKCDFYDHGCTEWIRREDLEEHHAKNGRKHAQLVASHVKAVNDDKEWHSQQITWGIETGSYSFAYAPTRRRFIQESQQVEVGPYQAFLRLATIGGEFRVFVCVDRTKRAPLLDTLEIDVVDTNDDILGWVDPEEEPTMEKDGSGNDTWVAGGTLRRLDESSNLPRNVTQEDVLKWCSSTYKVFVYASFRWKRPQSVYVESKEPYDLRVAAGVWRRLERS